MTAKRIIPCLDVRDGKVVKGVQFTDHREVGDIVDLAQTYSEAGADELVFYDISASVEARTVDTTWITRVAKVIDIPFCVAGGIDSVAAGEAVLGAGADKISINTPALKRPDLIGELAQAFGRQCITVGVDSRRIDGQWQVHWYTGSDEHRGSTSRPTLEWVAEAIDRGAGEIVLNCMASDGTRDGYDVEQLAAVRKICPVPLVASGGAGKLEDFVEVFQQTRCDAALAASVFHNRSVSINAVKQALLDANIEARA